MSWRLTVLILTTMTLPAFAQEPVWAPADATGPTAPTTHAGTQGFSNFIGFMSNPQMSIDPRSLTQVWPIFLGSWTDEFGPLPSTNFQVYGAGINLALTERFSVGLNQGGYADIHTDSFNPRGPLRGLIAARRGLGNQHRTGFLNLGGFAQYTLIANEETQTLFTVGSRFEAPAGSREVFQGKGPAYMSPYITVGQALGNFHMLATAGYEFPLRTGGNELRTFYANGHLDYQLFDWIYPLVEVNYLRAQTNANTDRPLIDGFFDLGNFRAVGELATLAVGVNFVLIRDRLELGGCWSTPVYAKRDFDFNSVLMKLVVRF